MSRVAFRWCVGSMARSRPTTPLRRPALSRCLRLTAPSPRMFSTANIDPAVYDDEMGDQFDPTESWGKPQAENRGTVTWWNQAKGIGMIKRVEDHKEFFVCKDEVKTDPFEEEPLIDLDDEKNYADIEAGDTVGREHRKLALNRQNKDVKEAEEILAERGESWKDSAQHLYPEMRVWFDVHEDELGPAAINVQWELVQV